jgi:hypothetical protein
VRIIERILKSIADEHKVDVVFFVALRSERRVG